MELVFTKAVAQGIGFEKFKGYLGNDDDWGYRSQLVINIARRGEAEIAEIRKFLEAHVHVRGVKALIKDVDLWTAAQTGPAEVKARNAQNFTSVLTKYLENVPGHRVYKRTDDGHWLGYFIRKVEYHPPSGRDPRNPPYCSLHGVYEYLGVRKDAQWNFHHEHFYGLTIFQALAKRGLFVESQDLRNYYLGCLAVFNATYDRIGKQYLCAGFGRTLREREYNRETLPMAREGNATRVVVDIFHEKGEADLRDSGDSSTSNYFWARERAISREAALRPKLKDVVGKKKKRSRSRIRTDDEDWTVEDEDREFDSLFPEDEDFPLPDDEEDEVLQAPPEIPVHPFVVIFDLTRHIRLTTHISNLTEYVYDQHLKDKLVLSADLKSLVHILIEHRSGNFQDIVKGKAGGAIVLLTGPPGVGKTLTAEVFAESEQKALYTVQCSQLGIKPDELEENLDEVFVRARRWNAVMLLDEADVYVCDRGKSLNQNAIVGVFLRVLEYQDNVLFLTSNRPRDIDDAIASRCVARIEYKPPSLEEQRQIWKILRGGFGGGATLSDKVIDDFSAKHTDLTGRDVKNLLKLSSLLAKGKAITVKDLEYVLQFRPAMPIKTAKEHVPD